MLLLLRGVSGQVGANLGIAFGLNGIAGPTAQLGVTLDLGPPTSVELNVFASLDVHFGINAISAGFLSRSANLTTLFGLGGNPGFVEIANLDIKTGLAGTVGSFLQGIANLGITCGLAGGLVAQISVNHDIKLSIAGIASIANGTLTPFANLDLSLTLNGAVINAVTGACDLQLGLHGVGTGYLVAANFPNEPYIEGIGPWDLCLNTYG